MNKAIHLPSAMVQAIGVVAQLVGDAPYSVVSEYPAHLPAIEGDEEPLVQVIASLIAYVVSETKREEIRIRANLIAAGGSRNLNDAEEKGLRDIEERGPWVVVSVADVEPGVPLKSVLISEDIPRRDQTGIDGGLALHTCQQIIRTFGGHLWLESEEDLGTRFQIALPLRATHTEHADVSSLRRAVDSRLPEGELATNSLLLMVEDPAMRDILTKDLVAAGYRAVAAQNGGDVLPLARAEQPDLVLLDLLSRDPTAADIALVLKYDRRTQNIPVLFLTTISSPEGEVRMGAANFLVRPVGTGALLATVKAVLHPGISPSTRVLVVEPDEVVRENMVMMIQAHGYRVTVASGPEEALALTERVDPGLVLVNMQLAQERDYWLLRGLRQSSEDIDIFVLAAALSDEEGRAAISRGASGYSETGDLAKLLDRVRGKQEE